MLPQASRRQIVLDFFLELQDWGLPHWIQWFTYSLPTESPRQQPVHTGLGSIIMLPSAPSFPLSELTVCRFVTFLIGRGLFFSSIIYFALFVRSTLLIISCYITEQTQHYHPFIVSIMYFVAPAGWSQMPFV